MAKWTDEWMDEARAEYVHAVGHYLDIDAVLADDLAQRVDRAIGLILESRAVAAVYLADTRRMLLRRFPFAIVYRCHPHKRVVEVVAFIHLRRQPGYWRSRL